MNAEARQGVRVFGSNPYPHKYCTNTYVFLLELCLKSIKAAYLAEQESKLALCLAYARGVSANNQDEK